MTFIERLAQNVEQDDLKIKRAYEKVGPYADYVVILEQGQLIANRELELNDELRALGVYNAGGKAYQRRRTPYMAVDGRIKMMVDEHKEAGKKFKFTQHIDWEHNVITVIWESEIYGQTVGTAKIGWDGKGADATNPIENAQTSAVGRALGQAGYGLLGGGIASAEEVLAAMRERASQEADEQAEIEQAPVAQSRPTPAAKAPVQTTLTSIKDGKNTTGKDTSNGATTNPVIAQKYDPVEVKKLINIKNKLGIKENKDLNPFVKEFAELKLKEIQAMPDSEEKEAKLITYKNISDFTHLVGDILAEFNRFMEKKFPMAG